ASAHTDCLIKLLKSGGNRQVLPGCEAAYLTLPSVNVKPYFSGLSILSSRQVCVFAVTTDAHYREFYDSSNSYFKNTANRSTFRQNSLYCSFLSY
ncbi:hypothetical protein, partial [Xenorhabdus koppenhoeferi]|uniref:hypothetical protein n=1 Tax=Xenorhabdus koppenhoeferi TaxID=351659 RepID=UPI001C4360E2